MHTKIVPFQPPHESKLFQLSRPLRWGIWASAVQVQDPTPTQPFTLNPTIPGHDRSCIDLHPLTLHIRRHTAWGINQLPFGRIWQASVSRCKPATDRELVPQRRLRGGMAYLTILDMLVNPLGSNSARLTRFAKGREARKSLRCGIVMNFLSFQGWRGEHPC